MTKRSAKQRQRLSDQTGLNFASSAYRYFLIWGIFTSLTTTSSVLIDTILIGNFVGSDGLAVLNIATPLFFIYILIGVTLGGGAAVTIGKCLGAADKEGANRVFSSLLTFGLIFGAISIIPVFFKDTFFALLGADGELYPVADRYIPLIMAMSPFFVMYYILSAAVRIDSDPHRDAVASAVYIMVNISFDVILMKIFNLGILGAAIAICAAQIGASTVLLTHFTKQHRMLSLSLTIPKFTDLYDFIRNGFGIGSENFFRAVSMLLFNTLLLRLGGSNGALYVAIYSVIFTVNTIPCGIFNGTANAQSSITAFLVGEGDVNGINNVHRRSLLVSAFLGAISALICALFPEPIICFFGITDGADIAIAIPAVRIFAASIIFTGINTVSTAFWQSTERSRIANTISVLRNCVLVIAFGALLIPGANINGLALAYVGAEVLTTIVVLCISLVLPSQKYIEKNYVFSGRSFEETYIIAPESAKKISEDLERIFEEWDISVKTSFIINFICEEILLNIIKYALNSSKKNFYISIKMMENKGDLVLRIRDNTKTYDPFESNGDDIDNGVLKVIKTKTKRCEYQRKMIFNYLYIVI